MDEQREQFQEWITEEASKIGMAHRAIVLRSNGQYRENWVHWSWVGWETSLRIAGNCK